MAQARRLGDLFVVGREVTFDDGQGAPISVYVRKLNTSEHERALRRANSERSKVLAAKTDKDSDLHRDQMMLMLEFTVDDLVDYLSEDERQRKVLAITAELADEEEWTKDNYLQGLRDAWADHLCEAYESDPQDGDAKRVHDEIERFDAVAQAAVDAHVEAFSRDLASLAMEVLREKAFDKLMDVQASLAWLGEYRMCELWLSVREPDRRTPYFTDRSEVPLLPNEVLEELLSTYREISVETIEGKASRQTDTS